MAEKGDTRARLLEAAHRLVAERGTDEVSTREVAIEAGQKNTAAVAYHFGSREGLFRELFHARIREVNESRKRDLDALLEAGKGHDVRCLLEAVVRPLADNLRDGSGGRDYIGLISKVAPTSAEIFAGAADPSGALAVRADIRRLLFNALPHVPAGEREPRIDLVLTLAVSALAHLESRRQLGGDTVDAGPATFDAEVDRIIDILEGGLMGRAG